MAYLIGFIVIIYSTFFLSSFSHLAQINVLFLCFYSGIYSQYNKFNVIFTLFHSFWYSMSFLQQLNHFFYRVLFPTAFRTARSFPMKTKKKQTQFLVGIEFPYIRDERVENSKYE